MANIKKPKNKVRNKAYCIRFNADEMIAVKKYLKTQKTMQSSSDVFRTAIMEMVSA